MTDKNNNRRNVASTYKKVRAKQKGSEHSVRTPGEMSWLPGWTGKPQEGTEFASRKPHVKKVIKLLLSPKTAENIFWSLNRRGMGL